MNENKHKPIRPFPLKFLTTAVGITMIFVLGLAAYHWKDHRDSEAIQSRIFQELQLSGRITHLDEVLTMSAKMNAATGESKWEKRYVSFEAQLDAAIKEAMALAPEMSTGKSAARVDAANLKLVEMEKRAFDLVRQGRRETAWNLLCSEDYKKQKRIYSDGIEQFTSVLKRHANAASGHDRRHVFLTSVAVIIAMLILLFSWIRVFRMIRRHIGQRNDFEKSLQDARDTLEERVTQRTSALSKSEVRLRSIVETAAAGILTINEEGRIESFNKAAERMFDYKAEEIIGKGINYLIPSFRGGRYDLAETVSAPEKKVTARRKEGLTFPAQLSVSDIRVEGRRICTTILRDISKQKHLEEDLRTAKEDAEAASRAKEEFLANMSHEIRTPLNEIIGMTELALTTKLTEDQRRYLTTVNQSGVSLASVINDILDFSKIEARKLELDSVQFNLEESLGETMKNLAQQAHEKDLELLCHVAPDVPDILVGDPGRIRQIVTNLIGNAVKFTEKGEVIVDVTVKSREGAEHLLHFRVRDTGFGLLEAKQKVIFEAFSQADSTIPRKFGGTGLGLSISSGLVRLMGGRIWVESVLGSGTTIHFTIRVGAPKKSRIPERLATQESLKDLRVLVVDDNATNRQILCEMLANRGMRPTAAKGGRAALMACDEARRTGADFSLALLDCHMPEMDGFELAKRMKEKSGKGDPTVLMMLTSGCQSGDAARCRELGISAHITKPVSQSDLLNAICSVLGTVKPGSFEPETSSPPSLTKPGRSLRILLAEDHPVNQQLAVTLLEKRGHAVVVANNGKKALEEIKKQAFD